MASLVLAEHDNTSLNDATPKPVTAAAQISTPVHVLVAGENCARPRPTRPPRSRAWKKFSRRRMPPSMPSSWPSRCAALILSLAAAYDAILAPATTNGKNILPRVAAKLDVPQISEILESVIARHFRAADLCRQCH